MAHYRKKPVVIEAMQFFDTEEVLNELLEFMQTERVITLNYEIPFQPRLKIATLEGDMFANEGDYIIKGISNEFYPCKPEIFEKTYEVFE